MAIHSENMLVDKKIEKAFVGLLVKNNIQVTTSIIYISMMQMKKPTKDFTLKKLVTAVSGNFSMLVYRQHN